MFGMYNSDKGNSRRGSSWHGSIPGTPHHGNNSTTNFDTDDEETANDDILSSSCALSDRDILTSPSDCASEMGGISVTNDGSTGHEMVDRTLSMVDSGFSVNYKDASFICAPYKDEVFRQQIEEHAPGSARRSAIIASLQDLGVKVFIIDSVSTPTSTDILHHVKRVVGYIAKENRVLPKTGPLGYQRCLLYQDHQGRLFNLMLSKHAIGPAGKFQEYLDSFSALEAVIALTVLSRSFPCASQLGEIDSLKPAYLSLILGLVLTEEISLSWLNTGMMVRAAPSVSAHSLMSPVAADLLRKLIVLVLAMAAMAVGRAQQILTLIGISMACMVILANLGSRAWHFMRWKPQKYEGYGASLLAYARAVLTGIFFPYMGNRNIEVGGKASIEYVIRTAFFSAVAFIISDIDAIQQFLVVGSENCDQNIVNFVVGIWWFVSLFCCLIVVRKIPYVDHKPTDSERLLVEDHASPSGYKIPSLPDYEIDPAKARTGNKCFSPCFEFTIGLLLSVAGGAFICYLAFTNWDEDVIGRIPNLFS